MTTPLFRATQTGVLLIGGPADGERARAPSWARTISVQTSTTQEHIYQQTLPGLYVYQPDVQKYQIAAISHYINAGAETDPITLHRNATMMMEALHRDHPTIDPRTYQTEQHIAYEISPCTVLLTVRALARTD